MSEIDVSSARVFSKTLFSMVIPEVEEVLATEPERKSVVLFGIETQVRGMGTQTCYFNVLK